MLFRSNKNLSDKRRWTLIICYNAVSNDAYDENDDRSYVPLEPASDSVIKKAGLMFSAGNEEHFTRQAYVPNVAAPGGSR